MPPLYSLSQKEEGLPRFAHDSPKVHSIKAATGSSGEAGTPVAPI
jgi:hypothetical protein